MRHIVQTTHVVRRRGVQPQPADIGQRGHTRRRLDLQEVVDILRSAAGQSVHQHGDGMQGEGIANRVVAP